MISKNKIKFIQSLSRKKEREETGLFIAEGEKLVNELVNANFQIDTIVSSNESSPLRLLKTCEYILTSENDLKKISLLKTPSQLLAIVKQPSPSNTIEPLPNDLILVLEAIQDPGNFGTIIRLASWFGIHTIICSDNCVDCYNPKVIQATMGAIAHVNIHYTNLPDYLSSVVNEEREVYGTYLEGENIYTSTLAKNGIIVLGNEGKGISAEVGKHIAKKIVIPSFSSNMANVESLNVSIAAAIVCSEFRRRIG